MLAPTSSSASLYAGESTLVADVTNSAVAEAEECFAWASQLYLGLGRRAAASFVLVDWTVHIDFPGGQFNRAMDRLEQALRQVADRLTAWGFVMIWRAMLAAELGQTEVCRDSVDEVFRVAELKKSPFQRSHGHWRLAVLSSYTGDAEATLHHIRQVELLGTAWLPIGSGEFLADAADLLDRVGYTALAHEYLARVKAEPKDAGPPGGPGRRRARGKAWRPRHRRRAAAGVEPPAG